MKFLRVALSERIEAVQAGQPEYLSCLIQQWAKMPIRTYFGSCTKQLQQLLRLLCLAPEANPSYQAVAGMICGRRYSSGDMDTRAIRLLATPIQANWAPRRKRGANE